MIIETKQTNVAQQEERSDFTRLYRIRGTEMARTDGMGLILVQFAVLRMSAQKICEA